MNKEDSVKSIGQILQKSLTLINPGQMGDKRGTNGRQTGDKRGTQPKTTFDKEDKWETSLSDLVGLQLRIAMFVYNECKVNRSKVTRHLSINYMVSNLKSPYSSVKKTIGRLIKKGIIIREELKKGRGGWVTYGIPELVFKDLFMQNEMGYKESTNTQGCSKVEQKWETQPKTSLSSSSSYYNNTTTTREAVSHFEIDCTPLADIGFNESHLTQVVRVYQQKSSITLTADQIQNSIYALAFDLKHNNAGRKLRSPLGVLLSGLKKGMPYCSITPDSFKTPREEALQKFNVMMEQQQQRERIEELKAMDIEFKKWLSSLADSELNDFCSLDSIQGALSMKHQRVLHKKRAMEIAKEFFELEVWPGILRGICC
jgi:hypothetical protein